MKAKIAIVISLLFWEAGIHPSWAQKPSASPTPPGGLAGDRKFDFTPTVAEQTSDGIPVRMVLFRDGKLPMQLNPPGKWIVSGSAAEMFFQNPLFSGARITLRASSLPVADKLDDRWVELVKPLILVGLPKGSNNQKIANVTPDGFNIAGWTSMEIKATYDQEGKRFAAGWLFLRLRDGRLLEIICTSRDEDFASVRLAMMEALRGWGTGPLAAGGR